MEIKATGRLGEDSVYVETPRGPRLLAVPFKKLIPVEGDPRSPFIKWGFQRLKRQVKGSSDDLAALARRALATPVFPEE